MVPNGTRLSAQDKIEGPARRSSVVVVILHVEIGTYSAGSGRQTCIFGAVHTGDTRSCTVDVSICIAWLTIETDARAIQWAVFPVLASTTRAARSSRIEVTIHLTSHAGGAYHYTTAGVGANWTDHARSAGIAISVGLSCRAELTLCRAWGRVRTHLTVPAHSDTRTTVRT